MHTNYKRAAHITLISVHLMTKKLRPKQSQAHKAGKYCHFEKRTDERARLEEETPDGLAQIPAAPSLHINMPVMVFLTYGFRLHGLVERERHPLHIISVMPSVKCRDVFKYNIVGGEARRETRVRGMGHEMPSLQGVMHHRQIVPFYRLEE